MPGINIRENTGRIDEGLPEANYQGMQPFISDSPWNPNGLMAQVAGEAEGRLGGRASTALYLDEDRKKV